MNPIQEQINEDLRKIIKCEDFKTIMFSTLVANTVNVHCIRPECPSSKGVNVEFKQTRSADESADKNYTCLECGTKWVVKG